MENWLKKFTCWVKNYKTGKTQKEEAETAAAIPERTIEKLLDEITTEENKHQAVKTQDEVQQPAVQPPETPPLQPVLPVADYNFLLDEMVDENDYEPEEFELEAPKDPLIKIARILESQDIDYNLSDYDFIKKPALTVATKYLAFGESLNDISEIAKKRKTGLHKDTAIMNAAGVNSIDKPKQLYYSAVFFKRKNGEDIFDMYNNYELPETEFSYVLPRAESVIAAKELLRNPLFAEYASDINDVEDIFTLSLLDGLNETAGYRTDKETIYRQDVKDLFLESLEGYISKAMPMTSKVADKMYGYNHGNVSLEEAIALYKELFGSSEEKKLYEYAIEFFDVFREDITSRIFPEEEVRKSLEEEFGFKEFDYTAMFKEALSTLDSGYKLMPVKNPDGLKSGDIVYKKGDNPNEPGRKITCVCGAKVELGGGRNCVERDSVLAFGNEEYDIPEKDVENAKKLLHEFLTTEAVLLTDEIAEVGLTVRIRKNSQYYHQHQGFGKIVHKGNHDDHPWKVQWPDEYENNYWTSDLEMLGTKENSQLNERQYIDLKSQLNRRLAGGDGRLFQSIESKTGYKQYTEKKEKFEELREKINEIYG